MFPSGGEAPQKSKKITVNLSLRTNLAMKEQLLYVILAYGQIEGCSFGTAKLYHFKIIMGAKPPKILENRDKFVLGNKSGNRGTSILRYFDFSRNSQNLSFQFYFGGEAPENFRKS